MSIKKVMAAALSAGMVMTVIPMVSMADTNGWVKDSTGWRYYTPSTGFIRNDWMSFGGKWYYFNSAGYMISGINNYYIKGIEYNFNDQGVCTNPNATAQTYTGWHKSAYSYYNWDDDEITYNYKWYYYGSDGEAYKGWHKIDGSWYYFDSYDGIMYSSSSQRNYPNYVEEDNAYYWFKTSGEMITGWHSNGIYWYYAKSNGRLCSNEWLYSGGAWYYFNSDSTMISSADNFQINGREYNFDSSGRCTNPEGSEIGSTYKGWRKIYNGYGDYEWYYYEADGSLCKGWKYISGNWYYFSPYFGYMYRGFFNYDGTKYFFRDSGEMATGWFKIYEDELGIYCYWGYADSNGEVYRNKWLKDNGKWYYFDYDGYMIFNENNRSINGVLYSFDKSGACTNPDGATGVTGWVKRGSDDYPYWNYYGSDGKLYKSKWLQEGDNWYYFSSDGYMVNDDWWSIDGKAYDFDKNGVCLNPYSGRELSYS